MILHDPQAHLDYGYDWAAPNLAGTSWLAVGETITTATIAPVTGLTLSTPAIVTSPSGHAAGYVAVWISGGTAGSAYAVTCHIVTSAGREDDRTLVLYCANR